MPSSKSKSKPKHFFELPKKKQVDVLIEWILLQAFITYVSMRKAAGARKPKSRVGRSISLFGATTRAAGKKSAAAKKAPAAKKTAAAKKSKKPAAAEDVAKTEHLVRRLFNIVKASPTTAVTIGSRAMQHAGSSGTLTYKKIVETLKKDRGMRNAVGEAVEFMMDSLKKTKHAVTQNSERARERVVTLTRAMEAISNSDPQLGRWAYETMTPHMRTVNDIIGVGGSLAKATSGAAVRVTTHYAAPTAAGIGALGISGHLVWTLLPKIHRLVRANSSITMVAATGAAFIYQDNGYGPEARRLVENSIQRGGEILSNAVLMRATGLVAPYAIRSRSPPRRQSPPRRGSVSWTIVP